MIDRRRYGTIAATNRAATDVTRCATSCRRAAPHAPRPAATGVACATRRARRWQRRGQSRATALPPYRPERKLRDARGRWPSTNRAPTTSPGARATPRDRPPQNVPTGYQPPRSRRAMLPGRAEAPAPGRSRALPLVILRVVRSPQQGGPGPVGNGPDEDATTVR